MWFRPVIFTCRLTKIKIAGPTELCRSPDQLSCHTHTHTHRQCKVSSVMSLKLVDASAGSSLPPWWFSWPPFLTPGLIRDVFTSTGMWVFTRVADKPRLAPEPSSSPHQSHLTSNRASSCSEHLCPSGATAAASASLRSYFALWKLFKGLWFWLLNFCTERVKRSPGECRKMTDRRNKLDLLLFGSLACYVLTSIVKADGKLF